MKYLAVNLTATNVIGLIIALVALVCMLFAKSLASYLATLKHGESVKAVYSTEEEEILSAEKSLAKKRYYENAFILIKLISLACAVAAALVVFL